MRPWFDVPVLEGSLVRLEPLAVRHAEDLAAAAEEDRGSYDFTLVPRGSEVGAYLAAQFARAARGLIPFAQVRRGDGRAVDSPGRSAQRDEGLQMRVLPSSRDLTGYRRVTLMREPAAPAILGLPADGKIIRKPRASCSAIWRLCCSAWRACRSPMRSPGPAARWRYGRSLITRPLLEAVEAFRCIPRR